MDFELTYSAGPLRDVRLDDRTPTPSRDYEADPARSETMILWAMIGIVVRWLSRNCPSTGQVHGVFGVQAQSGR